MNSRPQGLNVALMMVLGEDGEVQPSCGCSRTPDSEGCEGPAWPSFRNTNRTWGAKPWLVPLWVTGMQPVLSQDKGHLSSWNKMGWGWKGGFACRGVGGEGGEGSRDLEGALGQ